MPVGPVALEVRAGPGPAGWLVATGRELLPLVVVACAPGAWLAVSRRRGSWRAESGRRAGRCSTLSRAWRNASPGLARLAGLATTAGSRVSRRPGGRPARRARRPPRSLSLSRRVAAIWLATRRMRPAGCALTAAAGRSGTSGRPGGPRGRRLAVPVGQPGLSWRPGVAWRPGRRRARRITGSWPVTAVRQVPEDPGRGRRTRSRLAVTVRAGRTVRRRGVTGRPAAPMTSARTVVKLPGVAWLLRVARRHVAAVLGVAGVLGVVRGRIAPGGRSCRGGPVADPGMIVAGRLEGGAWPLPRRPGVGRPVRTDRHHRRGRLPDAERIQPLISVEIALGGQRIAARIELITRAGLA